MNPGTLSHNVLTGNKTYCQIQEEAQEEEVAPQDPMAEVVHQDSVAEEEEAKDIEVDANQL